MLEGRSVEVPTTMMEDPDGRKVDRVDGAGWWWTR